MVKSEKIVKGKPLREYMQEYQRRPDVKAKQREYYQRHADELNAKQRVNKVGNVANIRKLCLEHNLSKEIATAIAMDGKTLDEKMKERSIL